MIHQPPIGARDLFPLDVAQKRWIEERLQDVFQRWGYHRIITPTLERLDTLMAGGAIQRSTVIQLHDTENEVLGLRPELTASIARAAVTRMTGVSLPQRLYYCANVFRRATRGSYDHQHEFYQAGVELLGAGGVAADAEIVLLVADCLANLGLHEWHLILGDAGLTRSLLSSFPDNVRDQVREAIATLDRIQLETLPLSAELRDRALLIIDLRGRPADVLQKISQLDLEPAQRNTVKNLKALVELLDTSFANQGKLPLEQPDQRPRPSLTLDLSLIQSIDYYTGLVFEVVNTTTGGSHVLGQGGRYDQLLGLYHPQGITHPGIGFVLNIEDLHHILLPSGQLPQQIEASHWLVVPETPQDYPAAFAYAQKIRESSSLVRVEVELGQQGSHTDIRDYAYRRQIQQIAWILADGSPRIERL
jgi:ATP phosphoribosyltransferase regulatory subunit